ncbi:MAG: cation diffusion facilitator family transporter [Desulfurococcaceae archaeon]
MHPITALFIINSLSALLKGISITGTNSTSVFIDLLNDVGDAVGLGLPLIGLSFEKKKKSIVYPYGRRRALYVMGLISMSIFSGLIFTVALIKISKLAQEQDDLVVHAYSLYMFIVAFIVNLASLIIMYFNIKSSNHRDPSIVSGLIDSMGDISGSTIALSSVLLRNYLVNVIGSILLSFIILISAATMGYRYFLILIGRAPPRIILKTVLERVLSIHEIGDVNIFNAIMMTEDEYMLVLEVEVDKDKDVEVLEKLSSQIEKEIRSLDPRFKHKVVEFVAERKEPRTYKRLLHEIEN